MVLMGTLPVLALCLLQGLAWDQELDLNQKRKKTEIISYFFPQKLRREPKYNFGFRVLFSSESAGMSYFWQAWLSGMLTFCSCSKELPQSRIPGCLRCIALRGPALMASPVSTGRRSQGLILVPEIRWPHRTRWKVFTSLRCLEEVV